MATLAQEIPNSADSVYNSIDHREKAVAAVHLAGARLLFGIWAGVYARTCPHRHLLLPDFDSRRLGLIRPRCLALAGF